ncbi:hypothetical protein [Sphingobium psychrophilum]|nr:hypothetical protein [Sphingobium psychrophilum]
MELSIAMIGISRAAKQVSICSEKAGLARHLEKQHDLPYMQRS